MRQSDRAVLLVRPDRRDRAPDPGRGRLARCARPRSTGPRSRCSTPTPARRSPGSRARVLQRSRGAVLVRTGDGSVWIGHAQGPGPRPAEAAGDPGAGPASSATCPRSPIRSATRRSATSGPGRSGCSRFDFYNGAMSTGQCERLAAAVRHAAAQDTRVLIIRGGEIFSNGIHLNVIEAAPSPERRGLAEHQGHRRRLPRDHHLHPAAGA